MHALFEKALSLLFPKSADERATEALSISSLCQRIEERRISLKGTETLTLFSYRDPGVRALIHSVKYHRNKHAIELCAEALHSILLDELSDRALFGADMPVLIPIPISKQRLRERGFNQTALIAQKLFEIDGGNSFSIDTTSLIRHKNAPSQTSFTDKSEREKNIIGAFSVPNPAHIAGKEIILLDDVVTTGSTIFEAVRVLKEAGAQKIFPVALAH